MSVDVVEPDESYRGHQRDMRRRPAYGDSAPEATASTLPASGRPRRRTGFPRPRKRERGTRCPPTPNSWTTGTPTMRAGPKEARRIVAMDHGVALRGRPRRYEANGIQEARQTSRECLAVPESRPPHHGRPDWGSRLVEGAESERRRRGQQQGCREQRDGEQPGQARTRQRCVLRDHTRNWGRSIGPREHSGRHEPSWAGHKPPCPAAVKCG